MRTLPRLLLVLVLLGIELVSLVGFLAPWLWQGDMINPFRPQILYASLIALAMTALLKDRQLICLAITVVLLNGIPMAGRLMMARHLPAPSGSSQGKLSLISANVLCDNRQFDRVLALVAREDPDIFVAVETSPPWLDALSPLQHRYPYRMTPDLGIFGMSVYARKPFTAHIERIGRAEMPLAKLQFEDMTVFVAHPMPPSTQYLEKENAYYLQVLARQIKTTPGKVIVAGDLNSTLWSHNLSPVLAQNVQWPDGSGLTHTWPANSFWMAIQIDHIFTKGAVSGRYRVLKPVGSDHYPIRADLVF